MTDKQPEGRSPVEALRLADWLDELEMKAPYNISNCVSAAAELRRLHEMNQRLLEALEMCRDDAGSPDNIYRITKAALQQHRSNQGMK